MKKKQWGGLELIEVLSPRADGVSHVTIDIEMGRVDWMASTGEAVPIVYGEHKPLNCGKCTCPMSVLCLTGCQCGGK